MIILAIDPGNEQSAWVILDTSSLELLAKGQEDNKQVRALLPNRLQAFKVQLVVIEMVASYGMPVGKTVFETCVAIGRFHEIAEPRVDLVTWAYRLDVKLAICQDSRAKDANIRQALLDLYPPSGGGSTPQIGTKKEPGPLYGVSKDIWAALAVGVFASKKYGGIL